MSNIPVSYVKAVESKDRTFARVILYNLSNPTLGVIVRNIAYPSRLTSRQCMQIEIDADAIFSCPLDAVEILMSPSSI